MSEKLQKVLARAGFGSRRQIEAWIVEGKIKVNGKVAKLGDRVGDTDRLMVDGRQIKSQQWQGQRPRVLVYHKDVGTVCTRSDPEGRETVFQHLPRVRNGRWIAVGRLDISTTGLLIMTTDGELANRLMHPTQQIEREYLVRILGKVSDDVLQQLQRGVQLDDGMAKFSQIVDAGGEGANHWYRVVLHEGRNREVRRLWESQGLVVSRLSRIRFGPISLSKQLRRGRWMELSGSEMTALYNIAALKPPEEVSTKSLYRKLPRSSRPPARSRKATKGK